MLWADYGCSLVLYGMQSGNDYTFSSKFSVKNFGFTRVFCEFKIFNFKDDFRNLNNTVQYRSASAKAFHIDNEKTGSK